MLRIFSLSFFICIATNADAQLQFRKSLTYFIGNEYFARAERTGKSTSEITSGKAIFAELQLLESRRSRLGVKLLWDWSKIDLGRSVVDENFYSSSSHLYINKNEYWSYKAKHSSVSLFGSAYRVFYAKKGEVRFIAGLNASLRYLAHTNVSLDEYYNIYEESGYRVDSISGESYLYRNLIQSKLRASDEVPQLQKKIRGNYSFYFGIECTAREKYFLRMAFFTNFVKWSLFQSDQTSKLLYTGLSFSFGYNPKRKYNP